MTHIAKLINMSIKMEIHIGVYKKHIYFCWFRFYLSFVAVLFGINLNETYVTVSKLRGPHVLFNEALGSYYS